MSWHSPFPLFLFLPRFFGTHIKHLMMCYFRGVRTDKCSGLKGFLLSVKTWHPSVAWTCANTCLKFFPRWQSDENLLCRWHWWEREQRNQRWWERLKQSGGDCHLGAVHILRQPPEGGEGVWQMLTIADEGGRGVSRKLTIATVVALTVVTLWTK